MVVILSSRVSLQNVCTVASSHYDSRDYINHKKWARLTEQVVVEGKLRNGG